MISIDFRRLILWLLPVNLRTTVHDAWLRALYAPLRSIYSLFIARRDANLYWLFITPQVCYLEKMLNDRYDSAERRIYITDSTPVTPVYIYLEEEQKPVYIYTEEEQKPVYIYTEAEINAGRADFIVNVPASVSYNDREMQALLDRYKLAGKRYEIVVSG